MVVVRPGTGAAVVGETGVGETGVGRAELGGEALDGAAGAGVGAVKLALGVGMLVARAATAMAEAVWFPAPVVDTAADVAVVATVGLCAAPQPARNRVSPVAMPMTPAQLSVRLAMLLMMSP